MTSTYCDKEFSPMFTVTALLGYTDPRPIRARYDTIPEALAVAQVYRQAGFFVRVTF